MCWYETVSMALKLILKMLLKVALKMSLKVSLKVSLKMLILIYGLKNKYIKIPILQQKTWPNKVV